MQIDNTVSCTCLKPHTYRLGNTNSGEWLKTYFGVSGVKFALWSPMSLHTEWNCHSPTNICSCHGYVLASSSIGCVLNVTPGGRTNFFHSFFCPDSVHKLCTLAKQETEVQYTYKKKWKACGHWSSSQCPIRPLHVQLSDKKQTRRLTPQLLSSVVFWLLSHEVCELLLSTVPCFAACLWHWMWHTINREQNCLPAMRNVSITCFPWLYLHLKNLPWVVLSQISC